MSDEEKFYAWLDGELSGDEAAEVARRVAADPNLRQLAEQHRSLGARLKEAFDPILEAPVPDRLADGVRASPVIDLARARRIRERRRRASPPQWVAIAATLAIGVFVGSLVPHGGNSPITVRDGQMIAASTLGRALDTQLASAGQEGGVRIGLTFRDQSGTICRSFTGNDGSGLACRDHGQWQVRGMFAAPEGQSSDYRMAGGTDSALAALVDRNMSGEPFDAAQEKAAKERGWR